MTHARILTLDPAADPIRAAIARHRAAHDAFQVAPEGRPSVEAADEYDAAGAALMATACATRFGALALLDHLRWWIAREAEFAAGHQPTYGRAQTRMADLVLFLGTNLPPIAIPRATPSGRLSAPVSHRLLPGVDRYRQSAPSALPNEALPGEGEPWAVVAPIRPDTVHVRAPRYADLALEALTAVALIAGGVAAYGYLPFV